MAYTDYRYTNRDDWEFTYSGADLLQAARAKHAQFASQEREARAKMAEYMMNMQISQSDPRIAECKSDIEKFGSERERCTVWIHEFARAPEQIYPLQLGDVAYFGLAPEPVEPE